MRNVLLCLAMLVTIAAFVPDMSHLSADSGEHSGTDTAHGDTSGKDALGTNHCHNGVSCSGAIATRNQLSATSVSLLIDQSLTQLPDTNNSHMMGRDPPVPIETAYS